MRRQALALGLSPTTWVFVVLLAVYSLTLSGQFMISDGEVVFQTTVAIADRRELHLDCNPGLPQIVAGVDGRCFSKYGIGMPLLAAIAYRLGAWSARLLAPAGSDPIGLGHFGVSYLNVILTAATGALVFRIGRDLFRSRWLGLALALLYGLATSAWPYSKVLFTEPLIAFVMLLATDALLRVGDDQRGDILAAALAGLALGLGVAAKVATLVVVPIFGLYLLSRLLRWPVARSAAQGRPQALPAPLTTTDRSPAPPNFVRIGPRLAARQALRRPSRHVDPDAINRFPIPMRRPAATTVAAPVAEADPAPALPRSRPALRLLLRRLLPPVVAFCVPLAAWLALALWHNAVRFGSPLDSGYSDEGFTTPLYVGLYGLLLSSGKSIFLYSPIVLLALPGLVLLWRRRPAEALLIGGLSLVTVLYYAAWWAWYGGWSWGPRFLVPLLPFLVLAVGAALAERAWARWLALLLAAVGVGVQVLGVLVDFNVYIDGLTGGNPALEERYLFLPWLSPLVGHARLLWEGQIMALPAFDMTQLGFRSLVARVYPWLMLGALALGVTMLALIFWPGATRRGDRA